MQLLLVLMGLVALAYATKESNVVVHAANLRQATPANKLGAALAPAATCNTDEREAIAWMSECHLILLFGKGEGEAFIPTFATCNFRFSHASTPSHM